MLQVSIMQIASEKMVFIFDLIKLFDDVPDILDNCLTRILHCPRILKLGMKSKFISLASITLLTLNEHYDILKKLICT